MSLDLYLEGSELKTCEQQIFIREGGSTKSISVDEWNARNPDREPVVVCEHETTTAWHGNITHNLGKMAAEADLYNALWRPDEHGLTKASQMIEPLESGLAKLKVSPDHYKTFNPSNGWGDYDGLVEFAEECLAACKQNPDADVRASR